MKADTAEFALADNEKISSRQFFAQAWLFVLLVGGLAYTAYYAERYLNGYEKVILGWLALGLTLGLYRMKSSRGLPWRIVFVFLTAFLGLRYLLWRTFETLIYTGPLDLIGLALLYLAEVHAIMLHILSLFINISPLERKECPVVVKDDPMNLPTVDVMVPTYTEPDEIIRITAIAATQINYPKDKLRVHIMDDGSTIARRNNPKTSADAWARYYRLRAMAQELGVNYITREANGHAKAGNINHALRQTSGDLVLVLDCDHVPTRDILEHTVGLFRKDPKLYLVQTPHFFINPTPIEKNLEHVSNVSVENDMFFRIIHAGLDFWNSSYFCGSAAILRRKHLEEIGGIATDTITEDAETSLILHGKGYNSIYVNRPMVCGLSPETFSDYVTQRTRWAQGMVQLFILKNALTMRGLSIAQRICYFNSSFFWFFGISRFIYYISPALFLIFGLMIYHASVGQILAYALPYVLCTVMVMDFLYGKARQPFFSEIYESVQALFLIPAIISVMLNPHKPTFKITPKGRTIESESLNPLAAPFFLVVAINFVSLPIALYKWMEYPLFRDVILVTSIWCVFNILLALVSLGAFWEKRQVRRYHRIRTKGPARIYFPRLDVAVDGVMEDISLTGLSIYVKSDAPEAIKDEEALITVSDSYGESYEFKSRIKRWSKRKRKILCGAELLYDTEEFPQAVKFVYGDSQRWMDSWEGKTTSSGGVGKLLWSFLVLGLNAQKEIVASVTWKAFAWTRSKLSTTYQTQVAEAVVKN
ncbi:MAG: UDP-forming cellulose synthase catalytic subunit [Nitrospinae bacterium]|nr:UDP-forming cellulose synthase catalytic subunit [Nitrospinota bacterium]